MKGIWKIIKIILIFLFSLMLIALAWYAIEVSTIEEKQNVPPFVDFVLYLIGFADLNIQNNYARAVFSVMGLFTVTLMSSVFTVKLFELRRKVKINSKIIISDQHQANFLLNTANKDVYNLTATVIAKCGQSITTKEQVYPFVAKKTALRLSFDIAPGTPVYKYLREVYLNSSEEPQLILTVSYTDIETGQQYTMAQKYQHSHDKKSDIIFGENDDEKQADQIKNKTREYIERNIFPINLASVVPCNAEDIDISYGNCSGGENLQSKQAFCAAVHMDSDKLYEPSTFTMAVTKDLLENDWTTYYDLGCALTFEYKVEGNITVTMELKAGERNETIKREWFRPSDSFKKYTLQLQNLNYNDLRTVTELCFTVFYCDVDRDDPKGHFWIQHCGLEVE